MSERRKILLVAVASMSAVSLIIGWIAIWMLYHAAIDTRRLDLLTMLDGQARLMESVARFEGLKEVDRLDQAEWAKTLDQFVKPIRQLGGFGNTGEIVLGRLSGDKIEFLLDQRFPTSDQQSSIPMHSYLAEPMRRALSGERGTIIAPDYRGEEVLAAYEPVQILNLGIVAKFDIAEIRAPFLAASPLIAGTALLIIALGSFLNLRISNSQVRKLELGEARMRAILETAVDGIINIETNGSIVAFNSAAERIFGYNQQEVLGRNIKMLMPEPYRSNHDTFLSSYIKTGINKIIGIGREVTGQRSNGELFPIDLRVSEVLLGDVHLFTGIIRDITKRKQAENALKESAQRFDRAVRGTSDGLWDWNIATDEVWFAPQFKQLLGYEEAEFPNVFHSFESHLHDEDHDATLQAIQRHIKHGDHFDVEFRLQTRSGTYRWFRSRGEAVRDSAGRSILMAGSIQDITDRRLASEQLKRHASDLAIAKEQAEAADRVKSAFLATMSHELRTPLNSIIGFTGILLQCLAGPLNDEQMLQLNMVQKSSRHLLSLVNDVLDISKIEAGQMEIVHASFSVSKAVEKVVGVMGARTAEKKLALTVEIAPEVGEIMSDRRRFEQILLNLLGNSVKFTEEGGVNVGCRIHHGRLEVQVEDTGIGIAADDIDRLFQPFKQLDSGLSRRYEGSGLGLSICNILIDLMDGDIQVTSEQGRGSTFYLTLPTGAEEVT